MATVTGYTKAAIDRRQQGVFYVEDFGAVGDGSTDDTAAINSCITSAVAAAPSNNYYAEIRFQSRVYLIGGALQQGGAAKANAQIPLPVPSLAQPSLTLVFKGAGAPAAPNPYFKQTVKGVGGTVLYTTLTGQTYSGTYGAPCVIGGPMPEQGYGNNGGGFDNATFSNLLVVIDGLTVMTRFENGAGTMAAVHLGGVSKAHVQSLACIADATITQFANVANRPVNSWSTGLYLPQDSNNDNAYVGTFSVYGFYRGLLAGEHLAAQRIAALYCWYGISMHAIAWHGWTIDNASIEACQTAFLTETSYGGPLKPVFIGLLDCEDISRYTTGGYHISDPGNVLGGVINIADGTGNGSNGATIVKNGGGNLTIKNVLIRSV